MQEQDEKLIAALKRVSRIERWTEAEKREIWLETKKDPALRQYWLDLAEGYRTGLPMPVRRGG